MRILAVETSSNLGSVALFDSLKNQMSERQSHRQSSHSEFLHPAIAECLKEQALELTEVDCFAVGQGPGSFTGIRVAGNALKALAWSMQKPLVSIDSLEILAQQTPVTEARLLCMTNAFRNMVYASTYREESRHWVKVTGPEALTFEQIEELILNDHLVVGDGFEAYRDVFSSRLKNLLKEEAENKKFPLATCLAELVGKMKDLPPNSQWDAYSPLYLRSTDSLFKKQRP